MGRTLGEMTPEERRAVTRRAAAALQDELQRAAPAIGRALDEMDRPAPAADSVVRLSASQRQVLDAMAALGAHVTRTATAAEIGAQAWRSSDSVARTLRSLVRLGLAERAGFAADCWGYRLTDVGMNERNRPAI